MRIDRPVGFCLALIVACGRSFADSRAAAEGGSAPEPQRDGANRGLAASGTGAGPVKGESVCQVVRQFDFRERPLGNFEDLPMYWRPLTGPGFPPFSSAKFDFEAGRAEAPCVRLDLAGGNLALEYMHNDIRVAPQADYHVECQVRTRGLQHARAFMSVYLVNRVGQPITGSARASQVVPAVQREPAAARAAGSQPAAVPATVAAMADDEPWEPLEIDLASDHEDAYAMHIQLWLVQDYTWRVPETAVVDPITREEVSGSAWFDDVVIYRVPRVRLSFSDPAGLVIGRAASSVQLIAQNPGQTPLQCHVRIESSDGASIAKHEAVVAPLADETLQFDVPPLPQGDYVATAEVLGHQQRLVEQRVHFTVLAPLVDVGNRFSQFGIDVGRYPGGSVEGLVRAARELRVGAVKLGVPMVPRVADTGERKYFDGLRDVVAGLATAQIELCGTMLGPVDELARSMLTARQLASPLDRLNDRFGPVLAHLGGILTTWQLGDEEIELSNGSRWEPETLTRLTSEFERHVTLPRFVMPRKLLDGRNTAPLLHELAAGPAPASAPASGDLESSRAAGLNAEIPNIEATSIYVPPGIPVRYLPWALSFLARGERMDAGDGRKPRGPLAQQWLRFPAVEGGGERAVAALAHEIIVSHALGVERVYYPAPFELHVSEGQESWRPLPTYPVMRTLFAYLGGTSAHRVVQLPHETTMIVFRGESSDCAVIWSWDYCEPVVLHELDLGDQARAVDLWGREQRLRRIEGRTEVTAAYLPLILADVDRALIDLQSGIRVSPGQLEPHDPAPRLTVRIQNPYDEPLSGALRLTPPPDWTIDPAQVDFSVGPHQVYEGQLAVRIPPVEVAAQQRIAVEMKLYSPTERTLRFDSPIEIALRDIGVQSTAQWIGEDLVVVQTLRNDSKVAVRFSSFCQAPGFRRLAGAFLNVAPGEVRTEQYVLPHAAPLSGLELLVGIDELEGRRRLYQRVVVPSRVDTHRS